MVTWENYEEYMMLDADGELDSIGKEALQAFIKANPALEGEPAAWQALKLQPDAGLIYPDKEGLLKRKPKGMVLTLRPYILAVAAAVIAMLLLIPALWRDDRQDEELAVTPKNITAPAKVPGRDTGTHVAVIMPAVKSVPRQSAIRNSPFAIADPKSVIKSAPVKQDSFIALTITTHTLIEPLAANPPQMIQQDVVAAVNPPEEHQQHHESGLLRIHLAAANKPAFDQLKQSLEARIAQASSAAKSIRETALVIRLGNGSVNLNF